MVFAENNPYILKNGIHVRPDYSKFEYSDGDENEKRILEVLQQIGDLSTESEEMKQFIDSWVFEYHFSQLRHNLLRGFDLENFDNVLELGSGCGPITRQLAERCAQVTTVDGSFQRLMVAAERCRDLSNVSYYCENFEKIDAPGQFDLITMIGTLEYATLFMQGDDPVQTCLGQMLHNLTKDGVLLIAIENQLGLKYFNGCGEDHVGELFFGINDLYHKTATTFGYHELKQRILKAGFSKVEFLFPFPDYKLPQLIVREGALEDQSLQLGSIIGQFPGRDYNGRSVRHFAERLCWLTLARNRLIPDFSNSFLIIASGNQSKSLCNEEWLLKIFNLGRKSGYCTKSTFSIQKNENCVVQKQYLFPQREKASSFLKHVLIKESYVKGVHLGEIIAKGLLNEQWHSVYIDKLKSWVTYLQKFVLSKVENEELLNEWQLLPELDQGWLPGQMVDCIPRNLIHDGNEYHYIDQEWVVQTPIPLMWVVFRGLLTDISDQLALATYLAYFEDCTIEEWIVRTLGQIGFMMNSETFARLVDWEVRFIKEASGQEEEQIRDSFQFLLNQEIGKVAEIKEFGGNFYDRVNSFLATDLKTTALELKLSKVELDSIKTSKGYRLGEWVKGKISERERESIKAKIEHGLNYVSEKKNRNRLSKHPHHICMIVPSFDRVGGYERQAFSMCQAYQKMGKHPYIVTQNMGDLPSFEVRQDIEIFRFYPFFQGHTRTYEWELEKLFAHDFEGQIDIVHCHAFDFTSGWAIRIASKYGIPTLVKVATEQDILEFQKQISAEIAGFKEALENLMKATRFIGLNSNIRKELIAANAPEQKILALPNGVDVQRYCPATTEEKQILKTKLGFKDKPFLISYTGRFEERKRVIDLIIAWQLIAERFPQHHLVLVGTGEEFESCRSHVNSLNLSLQVTFVGEVANVEDYLKITDYYVFPSRLEGMPNVILEAMACGLPIVSTAIPGIVEVIRDGKCGFLVPPMDASALAKALSTLLSQPERAREIGRAARKEAVERYSFDQLGKRYFEIYQNLLDDV
ncbi:MAG: glycosyltransferase [SAR324 cluster bacterium]|nr:glycosyltransferase [SAR324 cluster bacterium]